MKSPKSGSKLLEKLLLMFWQNRRENFTKRGHFLNYFTCFYSWNIFYLLVITHNWIQLWKLLSFLIINVISRLIYLWCLRKCFTENRQFKGNLVGFSWGFKWFVFLGIELQRTPNNSVTGFTKGWAMRYWYIMRLIEIQPRESTFVPSSVLCSVP